MGRGDNLSYIIFSCKNTHLILTAVQPDLLYYFVDIFAGYINQDPALSEIPVETCKKIATDIINMPTKQNHLGVRNGEWGREGRPRRASRS